jgi:hypothetical protein
MHPMRAILPPMVRLNLRHERSDAREISRAVQRGSVFLQQSELRKWPYGSFESSGLSELVAQLVEQRPFKAWVVRSNRTELTTPWPRFPSAQVNRSNIGPAAAIAA